MATLKKRDKRSSEAGYELTDAEWAIMKVVWENEPCAAGTVQEALQKSRDWAYSTVKTTMDRMVNKGLLATHTIRNLNLFTAKITEDQAKQGELRRMLKRAFDGAFTPMMQFLIENKRLSQTEMKQLRKLIKEMDNKKEK
jgi:BlaI family penicillinase repressor